MQNQNLMRNDLSELPWADGQFFQVNNYLEAADVLATLRAGIDCDSVRRPLGPTRVAFPETNAVGLSTKGVVTFNQIDEV